MKKKFSMLQVIVPILLCANTDSLMNELKLLKPLDNKGVTINKVVEKENLYILRLEVKDERGTKFVPAAVTNDKKHVIIGTSYNAQTGDAEGVADLSKLEEDEAFSIGGENPKGGDFYVFTDPDCSACQTIEQDLKKEDLLKLAKVHVFFYPLDQIHPSARKKCEYVLSLPKEKRFEAYNGVKGKNKEWLNYSASAEVIQQLTLHSGYAKELGLKGTPSFFDKNGNEIDGGIFISYLRAIKNSQIKQIDTNKTKEK